MVRSRQQEIVFAVLSNHNATMTQSIILGIGTGRCGLASLAKLLNQQTEANCSFEGSLGSEREQ